MEQELKNTLKNVQQQIRFPNEIDIESILKKKGCFLKDCCFYDK